MKKILIIPDVHGRDFGKKPCENIEQFEKIIFLGDYVAPYSHENIDDTSALINFKQILDFKKKNIDKVVLLLGNHDFTYFQTWICECRVDYENIEELRQLYKENLDLFDLAWETEINSDRYFLSHAGVRQQWFKTYVNNKWFTWNSVSLPPADMFNNTLHTAYKECNDDLRDLFEYGLSIYSYHRGPSWDTAGSIIWADAREFVYAAKKDYDVMFICGHTQLSEQFIITDGFADLDVRKTFTLDLDTGNIEEFFQNS